MTFETIQKYFNSGMWNEKMVANAVKKGVITTEEYKTITGKTFE